MPPWFLHGGRQQPRPEPYLPSHPESGLLDRYNKMRLLDVKTCKLVDATDLSESELRSATLSHTWTKDEVTFDDIQNLSSRLPARNEDGTRSENSNAVFSMSGSIHAALTRAAATSCRRPSIRCSLGTEIVSHPRDLYV